MAAIPPVGFSIPTRRLMLVVCLLLLWATVTPAQAAGMILYVDAAATGANSGASWTNAYIDLQSALGAATSGDQIWVAAGVYKPTTDANRSATFQLINGVAVYGGFAGIESSLGQRDWMANVTTLSGDIGTAGDASDNVYHVVTGNGTDLTAILDGFTISSGSATGTYVAPGGPACGGGMYNDAGSPSISNVVFSANRALFDGGGMFNYAGSPVLTNVIFSTNEADVGGGMLNDTSNPLLINVTFSMNEAASYGGGLYNYFSSPSLTGVIFAENQADIAGGLYNDTSDAVLLNVILNGNQALSDGGGMYNYASRPVLTNAVFSANQAANHGAGMYNGNGGIPVLTNVTLSANHAGSGGGGIYIESGGLLLQNSVLWGNYAPSNAELVSNVETSLRYSLVMGQYPSGEGNLDGTLPANAPQFVREPDPGNDDYGDLRLLATSPALDVGDNAADLDGTGSGTTPIAGVATDLAGAPRLAALRGPGAVVDLGAYEKPNQPPAFTSTPLTAATQDVLYSYAVSALDPDPPQGSILTFGAQTKPNWLTLTDHGDGTAILSGTPSSAEAGPHAVTLTVTDFGGQSATQSFTIVVDIVGVNDAPVFTSTPVTTATVGLLYTYAITTVDADAGDTRMISAPVKPSWLTLTDHGDGTATLSGTPTQAEIGSHNVHLRVQDAGGLATEQPFTIGVADANDPPFFTSTPVTGVMVGELYTYAITTGDGDVGDTRTITAPVKPAWLTLVDAGDGTAILSGTPTQADVGSHPVQLRVQDAGGLTAEQSFVIAVSAAPLLSGSVTGLVFADLNGNGTLEDGEPGVAGVTVMLQAAQARAARRARMDTVSRVAANAVTDGEGRYHFDDVAPGDYELSFVAPPGYLLPQPATRPVAVVAGQLTTVANYALIVVQGSGLYYLPMIRR